MTKTDQGPSQKLAAVVAEVFAPAVLVAVITITIALTSTPSIPAGLGWALVAAVFCSGIPIWFLSRGAKAGKWDTHHVRDQKDRLKPLSVAVGSVVVGLAILILGGAPGMLLALVGAMMSLLVASTVITRWWKISLHAAIAAGSVATFTVTFGPWWWCGLTVVAGVSWSRVRTSDHSAAQVLVGAVFGLAVQGGLYAVLI